MSRMSSMSDTMDDPEPGRRWLAKALREASGEMHEMLMQALADGMPEAESLVERAWRLETVSAWQLGHLLFQEVDELPLHDFEWLEQSGQPDCYEQLREWYRGREQVCGVLYMMSAHEWEARAGHRFQGELDVETVVRGLHRSDLEILGALRSALGVT